MTTRESQSSKGLKGRHVLMALIGFFGVMLIANGIFVYFALATFSGGDTDPYRKGLHYGETLKEAERQAERGWRTEVHYDDKKGRLVLSLLDKTAAPVTGLHVGATLSRPATDKEDRSVDLAEVSQGVYAADVQLAPGLWVISVDSNRGGEAREPLYRLKQRLFVADRP
jgi:nitrogen fixation protein FixH